MVSEKKEIFDLGRLEQFGSFEERKRYCSDKLNEIGSGSSRTVYSLDENTVLKLAINQKGVAQNQTELKQDVDKYPIFAKTKSGSKNGYWVLMQKANEVTETEFKKLSGLSLDDFKVFVWWCQRGFSLDARGKITMEKEQLFIKMEKEDNFKNSTLEIFKHFIIDTETMFVGDYFRISSWGTILENGVKKLVIIDYGLTDNVWATHYQRKKNEEKKKIYPERHFQPFF